MQKGFAGIFVLIVVVIAALGGAYYLGTQKASLPGIKQSTVSPSPSPFDETANWKTYANEKFGYSIKYPSHILIQLVCPDYEKDRFYLTEREGWSDAKFKTQEVVELPTCARGGRYLIELDVKDGKVPAPGMLIEKKNITVDGVDGKRYVSEDEIQEGLTYWDVQVHVFHKNKTYIFAFDDKKDGVLFDQILSTFRFD